MTLFQLILIALIQGITEFLPISSSGHLILFPSLTGFDDQGQIIDVAVHVGTLGAVMVYFNRDVRAALGGTLDLCCGRINSPGANLAFCLLIATIPVVLAGLVLHKTGLDAAMRSDAVIGWAMLVFGLVLFWADRTGAETRRAEGWTLRHAIVMGLWQALALIPGTSRSGITITGARKLGYAREDAARLATLMSIPTIAASGLLLSLDVIAEGDSAKLHEIGLSAGLSFLAALLALAFMMRLARRISFLPYVIYRVLFGLFLLWMAYT